MTPPILDLTTSTPSVQQEITVSLVLLEADPLVANLAVPLVTFYQQKWLPAVAKETELTLEEVRADALVDAADHALDDFVDEFDTVLLRVVAKDRNDPLYAFYFGKKRPFELKRPVLGGQLEAMRDFVQPLKTASQTELADLGIKLEGLVNTADAAVKRQQAAVMTNKTFRTLGERKVCIDELNALRQSISGILSEMPHKHPDKRLPVDYAERFFKRASRRGKSSKEWTVAELQAKISEQEQVLAALKAQLAEALAKDEAEALAKAEKEALRTELDVAQKAAAEANARIAAIKAKLT